MKNFEVLNLLKTPIVSLISSGVRTEDVKYLQLYHEYKQITAEGNKCCYAAALMSEKYGVSVRTVYDIVKRLDSDCNFAAI